MPTNYNLHFIAIVIQDELANKIQDIQHEFSQKFSARRALHCPPHLTIMPPFTCTDAELPALDLQIEILTKQHKCFELSLHGFAAFPPRVIFVNPVYSNELLELQKNIQTSLCNAYSYWNQETMRKFHPHITVAFKDLTKTAFMQAWPEYSAKEFIASQTVKSIYRLKYLNNLWIVQKEFPLINNNYSS